MAGEKKPTPAQVYDAAFTRVIGSPSLYEVALDAAHAFAAATNCPAGYSVTKWLHERGNAAHEAAMAALQDDRSALQASEAGR